MNMKLMEYGTGDQAYPCDSRTFINWIHESEFTVGEDEIDIIHLLRCSYEEYNEVSLFCHVLCKGI